VLLLCLHDVERHECSRLDLREATTAAVSTAQQVESMCVRAVIVGQVCMHAGTASDDHHAVPVYRRHAASPAWLTLPCVRPAPPPVLYRHSRPSIQLSIHDSSLLNSPQLLLALHIAASRAEHVRACRAVRASDVNTAEPSLRPSVGRLDVPTATRAIIITTCRRQGSRSANRFSKEVIR